MSRAAKIWVIGDSSDTAIDLLVEELNTAGHDALRVDLSQMVQNLVRERGEDLIGSVRDLLRRGQSEEPEEQGKGVEMIVVASASHLKHLEWARRLGAGSAARVGVLTHYGLGEQWLRGGLNAYVVPHGDLVAPLVSSGVSENRVVVAGPPVPKEAFLPIAQEDVRSDMGVSAEPKVALILADGVPLSSLDKLVFQCTLAPEFQPIFVAGDDPERAELLRRASRTHGVRARMLGHIEGLAPFISLSDIVLAHADDPRVPSVLAQARGLALVQIEGKLSAQGAFLATQGVAELAVDLTRTGSTIERALTKSDALGAAAKEFVDENGLANTVTAIGELLAKVDDLRGALTPPSERASGPFEMIGSDTPTPNQLPASEPSSHSTHSTPSPVSSAQAKDELASLIMVERDLEKQVNDLHKDREQWSQRLELAKEWNETELISEAQRMVDDKSAALSKAQQELEGVRSQKDRLKSRVEPRAGSGARGFLGKLESKFRDMELESDLSSLKDRLRKELGE